MKSWRDILPIHPACQLFSPMTLGEDINKHGRRVPVTVWKEQKDFPPKLLDDRSRVDAIVGPEASELRAWDRASETAHRAFVARVGLQRVDVA
jgi:hypothetical protein